MERGNDAFNLKKVADVEERYKGGDETMIPFYEKDEVIIYCGECSQAMSEFELQSFDLTVTSPPYDDLRDYEGYVFDFGSIAVQLWRVTKKGGVVVWVVGDQTKNGSETGTSFRQALGFMGLGFRLHDTMIYEKCGGGPPHNNKYVQAFEYMFVLSNGDPRTINLIMDKPNNWAGTTNFGQKTVRETTGELTTRKKIVVNKLGKRTNIWRIKNTFRFQSKDKSAHQHPAIFPETLARDHIISWSNPGDLVLDPMMGSGTTLKMAQQLGRRCVGIDVSEDYCKIAIERLRQPSFWSLPSATLPPSPEQPRLNFANEEQRQ